MEIKNVRKWQANGIVSIAVNPIPDSGMKSHPYLPVEDQNKRMDLFEVWRNDPANQPSTTLVGEFDVEDVEVVEKWEFLTEASPNPGIWSLCTDHYFYEDSGWKTRQSYELIPKVKEHQLTINKIALGHNNNIDPCPFCGGKEGDHVFLGRVEPDHYQIVCCCCSVKMKHDRKDKVIGIWNNRKPLEDHN